jgi:hypothetical protein
MWIMSPATGIDLGAGDCAAIAQPPESEQHNSYRRQCGSCSQCCKVMQVPGIKPDHAWCPHVRDNKHGCKIYKDRPQPCMDFRCAWLMDETFKDYWQPNKCKIVIDVKLEPQRIVLFVVDPDYPLRWRDEPWFSEIKTMAKAGITGRYGRRWVTIVKIKDEEIVISP